jgi:5-methylcytosine-specific restriction enzyme B
MIESKRAEFVDLSREFASSYPYTSDGMHHVEAYEEQRAQGRHNFEAIVEAADRGEDVADQVLLKLLPYRDSPAYRNKRAWITDFGWGIESLRGSSWPS